MIWPLHFRLVLMSHERKKKKNEKKRRWVITRRGFCWIDSSGWGKD